LAFCKSAQEDPLPRYCEVDIPGARVDVAGTLAIRKRVSRAKVLKCFGELQLRKVGIEACPSAHHWSRELQLWFALRRRTIFCAPPDRKMKASPL